MEYPKFIVSNHKEESISIQRVKENENIYVYSVSHLRSSQVYTCSRNFP